MAYLGQKATLKEQGHKCLKEDDKDVDDQNNDPRICGKLNSAPNHFKMLKRVTSSVGSYDFISTRNNNFSNRAHTLNIVVNKGNLDREAALREQKQREQAQATAGAVGGVFVALVILAGIGIVVYMLFFKNKEDLEEGNKSPQHKPQAKTITTTKSGKV